MWYYTYSVAIILAGKSFRRVPEEFYIQEDVSKTHNAQFSYWRQECKLCELNEPHKEPKNYKRIYSYWYRVSKLTSNTRNIKHSQLFNLVQVIFSLIYGNVSAESGFSINKVLLDAHKKSSLRL